MILPMIAMMRKGTFRDISVNLLQQHNVFRKAKLGIALGVADRKRNRNVAATHKPMPVFNVAAWRIFWGEQRAYFCPHN